MMKKLNFKEHKNILLTAFQTIIILIIAAVITFVGCKFQIKNFRWVVFVGNFLFTTMMKVVYTNYSKVNALKDIDIVTLQTAIFEDKKQIYNYNLTEDFNIEVERINNINLLSSYISQLDSKKEINDKEKELRAWAFEYRIALEKTYEPIIPEFEEKKSIKSIKLSFFTEYERVDPSKLFTYGINSKDKKKKYTFNTMSSSLSRGAFPTIVGLILSLLWGLIGVDGDVEVGQMLIDFASYVMSIGLGIWWGFQNGKAIIQEDYSEVLNNIASLVREVKSKIFKKNNIKEEKVNDKE